MIQAQGRTSKSGKVHRIARSLRQGVQNTMSGADQQADLDDDADDDDDDDDDKKSDADEEKAAEAAEEKAEKELEAAQEAELKAAQRKKQYLEDDLESFKDDKTFDRKISAEVKLITNETQSPTLSSFL